MKEDGLLGVEKQHIYISTHASNIMGKIIYFSLHTTGEILCKKELHTILGVSPLWKKKSRPHHAVSHFDLNRDFFSSKIPLDDKQMVASTPPT